MALTQLHALAIPERCYRCGMITNAVVGALVELRGRETTFLDFESIAPAIATAVSPAALRGLGIGPVKLRTSRCRGTYLANGCIACDAILGTFPLAEALAEFQAEGGDFHDLVVAHWCLDLGDADMTIPVRRA